MKKLILAIDDSKAIRFLLQTVFGREYQIVTVPDGYSALYFLNHRNLPDLIIADPRLPDMPDWELIRQISTSGMYGQIPVVVLSSLDRHETEMQCRDLGVVACFMKPFNPVEMLESVKLLMNEGIGASVMAV
ncbi:MAG TPA: response regulator [Puia sp.]|uniref:response regulator n=1 Tax=Puia sp. TaxID=2045100 RepID=UPI002BCBCC4F|nr:response regulator [Puia sp.]HVU95096.1 response regulator [Puia sp.]